MHECRGCVRDVFTRPTTDMISLLMRGMNPLLDPLASLAMMSLDQALRISVAYMDILGVGHPYLPLECLESCPERDVLP